MNNATTKRLFQSIETKDRQAIDEILDKHADALEVVGFHNRNVRDKTPLMYAIQCCNVELSNYLLDRGAEANAVMPGGPESSVLALCMIVAHSPAGSFDDWIQLTNRLLDLGADPTSAIWTATAHYKGFLKKIDLVELLYRRGANIDKPFLETGESVREVVAFNKSLHLPELLALFEIQPD